jgi:hypothetical protein
MVERGGDGANSSSSGGSGALDYLYHPEQLARHLDRVAAGEDPRSIPFAGASEVSEHVTARASWCWSVPSHPGHMWPWPVLHTHDSSVTPRLVIACDDAACAAEMLALLLACLPTALPLASPWQHRFTS